MVTPLTYLALNLHESLQSNIFWYGTQFHWNPQTKCFCLQENARKFLDWMLINFIILNWTAVVNSLVVLTVYFYSDYKYPKLSVLQILVLIIPMLIAIPITSTAIFSVAKKDEWVLFFRSIFAFCLQLHNIDNNYFNYFISTSNRWTIREILQNWHAYLSFDSNNGQRDYSGVVQVGCVLVTTFLSFVLPVFVFLLELDAPCHFFRLIFPMHLQNRLTVKIITQSVRIFIGWLDLLY